jgi:hypothetical protein
VSAKEYASYTTNVWCDVKGCHKCEVVNKPKSEAIKTLNDRGWDCGLEEHYPSGYYKEWYHCPDHNPKKTRGK